MKPRISVVIICYNQEKLISRALDSVLMQKECCLKDIIVSDDCSTDKTWDVVLSYRERFPDLVRPYRNVRNMGIYANIQEAYSHLENTDIVFGCAGDDEFCQGLFEGVCRTIEKNKVDLSKDLFTISCDWKEIKTTGKERLFSNKMIEKFPDKVIGLKLRQLIFYRSCCVSYNVCKLFKSVPTDKGISFAEEFWDLQPYILSEKNYYFQHIGSVYYSGIGVSLGMQNREEYRVRAETYDALSGILDLEKSDKKYLEYLKNKNIYYARGGLMNLLKTIVPFIASYRIFIPLKKVLSDLYHLLLRN